MISLHWTFILVVFILGGWFGVLTLFFVQCLFINGRAWDNKKKRWDCQQELRRPPWRYYG